jgi:hypothetical protein
MGKRLTAHFVPRDLLFVLAFLIAPVFLLAQDDFLSFGDGLFDDGTNFPILSGEPSDYPLAGEEKEEETPQAPQTPQTPKEKGKFRVKNRTWELSIANIGFDVSNNFVAASDIVKSPFYMLRNINDIVEKPGLIWQEPIVIDVDRFFDGFKFNFGASIKPFSFNFNWKDEWGFGLDIAHIDITGNMSLSGNLVTISEAVEDKFGVGGAAFVDVGVPVFFHYRDFKIKLRPAAYVPVIYTEPKVTYTYTEIDDGTRFEIDYDLRIYTLVRLEGTPDDMPLMQTLLYDAWDIPKNNLGYDFRLNVEYPWRYNIDIGVDMVNIPVPFAAARLYHYMHMNGLVWVDTSKLDVTDLVQTDEEGNRKDVDINDLRGTVFDYPDEFTAEYKFDDGGKKIYRPFAMVFYANYRPFESRFLTLIPSLGFSINALYPKIAAIEGGLTARFETANMLITTLGINYNDRRWKNSIDFILNLRAFELDLGLSFSSQDFVRSWHGSGLGINFGLKFGW